ncbi:dipeptidase [bacterium]|nr:dipeptidase [bacterium]
MSLENLKSAYQSIKKSALDRYFEFIRFESVSSEAEYKDEVLKCADWLDAEVKKLNFKTTFWQTDNYPVLFAENTEAGPTKPTVLLYGHYDVQPVDPLELWESPPFEPTIKGTEVYARGAEDNKGQCSYVLAALEMLQTVHGKYPVNIKLCIEGEEEIGSPGLLKIVSQHARELKADHLLIVDVGLEAADKPAITLGVRGLVTMDVELTGSRGDLHSGANGNLVYNPNRALVEILAKARDEQGKVLVPGFYDKVLPVSADEKALINLEFDQAEYERLVGAKAISGEQPYPLLEAHWLRPTFEINGIGGGYTGSGFKTVIPAKAIAKISCRLVPNQDPWEIGKLVQEFIEKNVPEGIECKVTIRPGVGTAVRSSPHTTVAKVLSRAYEEVLGKSCDCILNGASIPITAELAKASGADILLVGYGLIDDNIHAPNEHFGLGRFENGALTIARALELFGE